MKLLNLKHNNKIKVGMKTTEGILDIETASEKHKMDLPKSLKDIISENKQNALETLHNQAKNDKELYFNENEIEFAPIIMNPEKLLFVGLNYLKHVAESQDADVPEYPVLFSKFNNALASHTEEIPLPTTGSKFDYEAELVVVIGKETKDVSKENALSHVFGYSIGNDLSIRDLQYRSGQWLIGKTADKFAPVGPYIVTAEKIDPTNLNISMKRNGETVQNSNTSHMIFDVATIVSYASEMMTLKPGDLIFTGTPDGVIKGYPENEQVWLKSGDQLEASIENIGTLKNKFV